MTEQAKLFTKEAQGNEALKARLAELEHMAQGKAPEDARKELIVAVTALAREYGYKLSEADFKSAGESLDDDEMEALSGGGIGGCGCPLLGGGAGKDPGKGPMFCGCIIAGVSFSGNMGCLCTMGGAGE